MISASSNEKLLSGLKGASEIYCDVVGELVLAAVKKVKSPHCHDGKGRKQRLADDEGKSLWCAFWQLR
jgi:hypothetical protein